MRLQPIRPPGRSDRKAAAYAAEIARLRLEGYTYEAIREALADVGITLSTSALRREVRRSRHRTGKTPPQPPARLPSLAHTSGREIAQAFFNAHPSNPLLRAQEIQ